MNRTPSQLKAVLTSRDITQLADWFVESYQAGWRPGIADRNGKMRPFDAPWMAELFEKVRGDAERWLVATMDDGIVFRASTRAEALRWVLDRTDRPRTRVRADFYVTTASTGKQYLIGTPDELRREGWDVTAS